MAQGMSPPDGPPLSTAGNPTAARPRSTWLIAACLTALSVPLLIALAGFRRQPWTPVLDLAMTELRVRDVGGSHTPLIGLPGRIGTLAEQGSHPGPISFYLLAPIYRLLGSTSWALQVATSVIHLVGVGAALVIANRRGGARVVLAVALLLAVLMSGLGGGVLTEPWNPYLPLTWWVVVLLAVWSVLCGDLPLLPVVVVAGSFCGQTHVPYLGLTLGLGGLAAVWAAARCVRRSDDWRRGVRWGSAALGVGILLWVPPTIDQLRHDPGNYRVLADHFRNPPEEAHGLGAGLESALVHFDVVHVVRGAVTTPGGLVQVGIRPSETRGAIVLALWAAAAAVSVRRGSAALRRLHVVVGASGVLMIVAISRVFGRVWYYLTLWGWAVGLLGLLAILWTVAEAAGARDRERWPSVARRLPIVPLPVALTVVGLLVIGRFAASAWTSQHADAPVAAQLASVVDQVAVGLEANEGAATGRDGRYLVSWSDVVHIGSQGYGLLNELERRSFEVGVAHGARVPATAHRVLDPARATARVHLATGINVERWREVPGAVELVSTDPRSASERVEQDRLRREVIDTLWRLGLGDLVRSVDDNLFGAAIDVRVPDATQRQMGRMLEIGAPLAVFVAPIDAVGP